MTSSRFGTARRVGGTHVLRYERQLAHPVDAVWAAITEPDRLAGWLATAEQTLAGWHSHLDALERALAGAPADWPRWTEDHLEEWTHLRDRYAGATGERA